MMSAVVPKIAKFNGVKKPNCLSLTMVFTLQNPENISGNPHGSRNHSLRTTATGGLVLRRERLLLSRFEEGLSEDTKAPGATD